jgi:AraC-like DNA-binding protein
MDAAFAYYRHLARVLSYVESHPLDSFKLGDIAVAIGISSGRLSHLFRERLGISFSEWMTRRRIDKAIKLIQLREISTTELAHLSGFGSYRSFERSFKKITGTTPSNYKKNLQSQIVAGFQGNLSHM